MNNFNYKNKILGLNKNNNLPYSDIGHVRYLPSQNISYNVINNTLNQFVDNDKFIESKISSDLGYKHGPKSDDEQMIYQGENGYKYYKDENSTLAIYRKVENDINDDIRCKISKHVNFVVEFGDMYFCGCSDYFRYSSDLENWNIININNVQGYYVCDTKFIVAASDGIYNIMFDDCNTPYVDKMNSTTLKNCKCVNVDSYGIIYVGCEHGIYKGDQREYEESKTLINFERIEIQNKTESTLETVDTQVNDITINDTDIKIATDRNVYVKTKENTILNYKKELDGSNVRFTIELKNYTFTGTSDNLYVKYGDKQYYAQFTETTQTYCGLVYGKHVYIGTEVGLYDIDLTDGILLPIDEYKRNTSMINVKSLRSMTLNENNVIFGVTDTTLFYFTDVQECTTVNDGFNNATDIRQYKDSIYVSSQYGLGKITTSKRKYQTDTIESYNKVNEDCNKGIIRANSLYYVYGDYDIACITDSTKQCISEHLINGLIEFPLLGTYRNVIGVYSDSGLQIYNPFDNTLTDTSITDSIQILQKYKTQYIGVITDSEKTYISLFDSDMLKKATCEVTNDVDRLYVDSDNVYALIDGNIYRYIVDLVENTYIEGNNNFNDIADIFDNGSNSIMIVTNTGITESHVTSIKEDSIDFDVNMSEPTVIYTKQINNIHCESDGSQTTEDYYVCNDDGIYDVKIDRSSGYYQYQSEEQKYNQITYDMTQLGDTNRMIASEDKFVIKTSNFDCLSATTTNKDVYTQANIDLFYYIDGLIVSKSNDKIYRTFGSKTVELTCLSPYVSTVNQFIDIDEEILVFTTDGISALYGTNITSITNLKNISEIKPTSGSVSKINYNIDTIEPIDEKIIFANGNKLHQIYFQNKDYKIEQIDTLDENIITTDKYYDEEQSEIDIWAFTNNSAVKFIANTEDYYSPITKQTVVSFDKTIISGFVLNNNELIILDDDGQTFKYSSGNYTSLISNVKNIIRTDNTYSNTTIIYIVTNDNKIYEYDSVNLKYIITTTNKSIQSYYNEDTSTNDLLVNNSSKIYNISYSFDQDYEIDGVGNISKIITYGNIFVLLKNSKIYYLIAQKYTDITSSSLKLIADSGSFTNDSIIKLYADSFGNITVLKSNARYNLTISESGVITSVDKLLMSTIKSSFTPTNVITYQNKCIYESNSINLFDSLNGYKNRVDFIYVNSTKAYYRVNNYYTVSIDETYTPLQNITQFRKYNDQLYVSFDDNSLNSGIYNFSNGGLGDIATSKERELYGQFTDFCFNGNEFYYCKETIWYHLTSNSTQSITTIGYIRDSEQIDSKDYLIAEEGTHYLTYKQEEEPVFTDIEQIIYETNIRKILQGGITPIVMILNNNKYTINHVDVSNKCLRDNLTFTVHVYDTETKQTTPTSYSEFTNIEFTDNMGVGIAIIDDLVYIGTKKQFVYVPISVNLINSIQKDSYYYINTEEGVIRFTEYGTFTYFINLQSFSTDNRYNKFISYDGNLYLCGQYGLYQIKNELLTKISSGKYNYEIYSFIVDESQDYKYFVPITNCVYTSNNIRLFKTKKFEIENCNQIYQILKLDSKNYLFASDTGLYKANYSYTVVNDIKKYGVQDAINTYNDMLDDINEYYQNQYNYHIQTYHKEGSVIDVLNNDYINRDFQYIDDSWQTQKLCADYQTIQNDIVEEIIIADETDGDIVASSQNVNSELSGLANDNIGLKYILKRWKSGMCELYIHLKTTNTYYLPFNKGIPNCEIDQDEEITRINLNGIKNISTSQRKQSSRIGNHYTRICLNVMSSMCFMDNIEDIQINGNSLPLKVYKDRNNLVDTTSQRLYQSFIEPSVVESYDISKTNDEGYYDFYFRCFGSDAQSIRIQFNDSQHLYGINSFIVIFDSNGGSGTMKNQRFSIGQQQQLRKNKFTKTIDGNSRVFLGWSLTKQNENTDPQFKDMDQFSDVIAELEVTAGQTIKLYAVWLAYAFGDNDTKITLNSTMEQFYISHIGIIPNQIAGDNIIVDFGD